MKGRVTIYTLLFFMVFRQGIPDISSLQSTFFYSILRETNLIFDSPRLGWIEDKANNNPELQKPGLPAFYNNEQKLTSRGLLEQLSYFFSYHPNPLLIDRPPPDKLA